jgi:hypothetical protein
MEVSRLAPAAGFPLNHPSRCQTPVLHVPDTPTVLALTNGDLAAIAFLAAMIGSIGFLLVRFVVRLRNDDVEVATRWSDHVTGGRRDQTPEEAVEEWERKRRKRSRFRR